MLRSCQFTVTVPPRIDPVNADVTARRLEPVDMAHDVGNLVPRRAAPRGRTVVGSTRPVLERDDEERRGQPPLELEIPIEVQPEVPREAGMDERQLQDGQPVAEEAAE